MFNRQNQSSNLHAHSIGITQIEYIYHLPFNISGFTQVIETSTSDFLTLLDGCCIYSPFLFLGIVWLP
jgi:uncharacterized membrane protein YhdT